jgi:hypothetical protein
MGLAHAIPIGNRVLDCLGGSGTGACGIDLGKQEQIMVAPAGLLVTFQNRA